MGGAPSVALRRQQWSNWQFLTHEYIHTLEHPTFQRARGGNRVLFEGLCEHFTLEVLRRWVPIARADTDAARSRAPTGAGALWPGFRPAWVQTPDPGEYDDYVRHTRRIRAAIGAGGENALRAAFFQGHIELIGLEPDGSTRTTPLDLTDQVHVPAGIPDRAALATASGVPESEIAAANPALAAAGSAVHFGMAVALPGCREHVIVEARAPRDVPGGAPVIETPQQIATQHGIAEADLRRANPAVTWASLHRGDHVPRPAALTMAAEDTPLRALVHGDLATWTGVPPDADADWVRRALGDGVEDVGGELLIWRGGAAGPEGVLISLAGGRVELVELPDPRIGLDAVEALGEPELNLATPWSRVGSQLAWPSRGLAVHASFDGVFRVVGFVPMAADAFAGHPVGTGGKPPERRPRPGV